MSRVWFTLVASRVLSSGHRGGERRGGGDILVFTMRRFKENVTSRVTHVFWRLRLRSTTRTSEKGLNVKLNFARSSVKS